MKPIQGLRDLLANNIEAIILYGSVARNESTPESDIDIAVIVKKGMDIETKRSVYFAGPQIWICVMIAFFYC